MEENGVFHSAEKSRGIIGITICYTVNAHVHSQHSTETHTNTLDMPHIFTHSLESDGVFAGA